MSEDETYLFEEDKILVIDETNVGTKKGFHSQEDRVAVPKKNKLKVMEFASIIHQGKTLKMVGELAPGWRPKTRPKNKLRLNMKKLLNPKLNKEGITVIDDSSSDEKLDVGKGDSKGKKPMKSEEESSLTETKLSDVFLEIRGQMLKEQQKDEIEVSHSENKLMVDENVLGETEIQENLSFHDTPTELLPEDEEIYRRLNIPWLPNELQSTIGNKAFDSEK